jgi:hypothetical protein
MTTAVANNDPTILIRRDEKLDRRSACLAILFAESINAVAPHDPENGKVADETIAKNNELVAKSFRSTRGRLSRKSGLLLWPNSPIR